MGAHTDAGTRRLFECIGEAIRRRNAQQRTLAAGYGASPTHLAVFDHYDRLVREEYARAAHKEARTATRLTVRFLFRPLSLWIGAHWSRGHRRWCVNFVPCFTVSVVLKGGTLP